jgi:hypothetical protein
MFARIQESAWRCRRGNLTEAHGKGILVGMKRFLALLMAIGLLGSGVSAGLADLVKFDRLPERNGAGLIQAPGGNPGLLTGPRPGGIPWYFSSCAARQRSWWAGRNPVGFPHLQPDSGWRTNNPQNGLPVFWVEPLRAFTQITPEWGHECPYLPRSDG